jgi:tRNA modification GTPase
LRGLSFSFLLGIEGFFWKMETILAPATPPGRAALAIVRVSGPQSRELTESLVEGTLSWEPGRAKVVRLQDRGKVLDQVVLLYWQKPRSFTGEDMVELICHGNPYILQGILSAYIARGARLALPGEFTQRAFLNGKLDLTQAEAIQEIVQAQTPAALEGALGIHQGKLRDSIRELREGLLGVVAHLEAYVDFPEEDVPQVVAAEIEQTLLLLEQKMEAILQTAPVGRILREGVSTAIVGAPNVGKSSLFNALLREDRAIVSPVPGTTRDTIETECHIGGFCLRLIDTAGRRETEDWIEREGVRRAEAALAQADLVLYVVVAPEPEPEEVRRLQPPPGKTWIIVANKCDLGVHPDHRGRICVSAKTGEGLQALQEEIVRRLTGGLSLAREGWVTINPRHEGLLRRAQEALSRGRVAWKEGVSPELVSIDLREALELLGEILGLGCREEVLDELFRRFCIGK